MGAVQHGQQAVEAGGDEALQGAILILELAAGVLNHFEQRLEQLQVANRVLLHNHQFQGALQRLDDVGHDGAGSVDVACSGKQQLEELEGQGTILG